MDQDLNLGQLCQGASATLHGAFTQQVGVSKLTVGVSVSMHGRLSLWSHASPLADGSRLHPMTLGWMKWDHFLHSKFQYIMIYILIQQ